MRASIQRVKKSLQGKGIPESIIRREAVITFEAEINIISMPAGTIQLFIEPDAVIIEAKDMVRDRGYRSCAPGRIFYC